MILPVSQITKYLKYSAVFAFILKCVCCCFDHEWKCMV